jgi:hypothetical protein
MLFLQILVYATISNQNIPVIEIRLKRLEVVIWLDMKEMAGNPDSRDKSLEALDFIINVLREHEQILDKAISELVSVTEQIGNSYLLNSKMEKIEEKISNLQKEMTTLFGYKPNFPIQAIPAMDKKQESQIQLTPADSNAILQRDIPLILTCKQWSDFQVLATHAQTLTFNIKETEKIFQVEAFRGKQIIRFTGVLPNFALIFKTWLCRQLDSSEQNVLEGFLDKPK